MERLDSVIVGAGIVGLAVVHSLALAGREVIVLEAEPQKATTGVIPANRRFGD